MTSPRTILARAAIALGCIVAFACLTGAAPPLELSVGVGACEPDGTSVVLTDLWAIEREANDYAGQWGYGVTLSRVPASGAIAGYVMWRADPEGEPHLCFFVPRSVRGSAVGPYVQLRTHESVRALAAARRTRWTE